MGGRSGIACVTLAWVALGALAAGSGLAACGKKEGGDASGKPQATVASAPNPSAAVPAAAGAAPEPSEAEAIAQASDWVKREGGSLVISLANGYAVTLKDDSAKGAAGRAYAYKGHLKAVDEHHVRAVLGGEEKHLLIDGRTGSQKEAAGRPLLSPDGTRLLAARLSEDPEEPSAVQVWRKVEDTLRLEFEAKPADWGPATAAWVDSATARFGAVGPARPADMASARPKTLARSGGAWTLKDE